MMHKLTLATLTATLTTTMMVGGLAFAGYDAGRHPANAVQDQANQQADNVQQEANQKADALKEQANDKADALKQQASNINDAASKRANQITDQGKEQAKWIKQRADEKTEAINNSHKHSDKTVASNHLNHDQIRNYQQNLKQLGYLNSKADGVVGPKTHHAIRKFQSAQKLAVNGKLDRETQQRLSQNAGQAGK